MNNQLLIPDDKIYIYPSDWKQPVRIHFENGSTIDTVNYSDSHHTIQFDKWVDYNTIVTDETLQKFHQRLCIEKFYKRRIQCIYSQ